LALDVEVVYVCESGEIDAGRKRGLVEMWRME
jgi:hypothetical protein